MKFGHEFSLPAMAPRFRAASGGGAPVAPVLRWANSDSSGNLAKGANTINVGDLLVGWTDGGIVSTAPRGAVTLSPSTFTALGSVDTSDGALQGTAWYKIAAAGDDTQATWTAGNKEAAVNYRGGLLCYQAGTFDTVTPVTAAVDAGPTDFTTICNFPAITVPRDSSRVLCIAIANGSGNMSGTAPVGPTWDLYNSATLSSGDPPSWAQAFPGQSAGTFAARALAFNASNGTGKRGITLCIKAG